MLYQYFEPQSFGPGRRVSAPVPTVPAPTMPAHTFPALAVLILTTLFYAGSVTAADFYVDPVNGDPSGNGSLADPWQSIEQVINGKLIETQTWASLPYSAGTPLVPKNAGAPIKAGDTLWLKSGYHGDLNILRAYNTAPITIAAVPGERPRLGHVDIVAASNWVLRGLGDDALFEYNVIKNAYSGGAADENHDDGFQSWSVGPGGVGTGEVRNVILRGNIIISNEDPNHPLQTSLQGIGLFDGFYVNWTVENNVIATDHWHGISFYGLRDSKVINNTVLDINDQSPGPPWIRVGEHKNGTPTENVIVRNNLATNFIVGGINVTDDANIKFNQGDADAYFIAAPTDMHLLETAPAVDAGSADQAPLIDLDGVRRPQGAVFDVGAYEWFVPVLFADGFED